MASDAQAPRVTDTPVLVTGLTGFVGSHTAIQLLRRGYNVRGTVRDASKTEKYQFVLDAAGDDASRLEVVTANLGDEASWIPACEGCEIVHHIASPYSLTVDDPQRDLVDPAVNGTLNVLKACTASSTTRKVIVTSSLAAVSDSFDSRKTYDENDWNETSSLTRNPYYYSKVLAERAAHDYVAQTDPNLQLAVVNPFVVLGPALNNSVNASVDLYQSMLNGGQQGVVDLNWGIVDVRDVAKAHILAMETEGSSGRYLVCHGPHSYAEVARLMRKLFPDYPIPCTRIPNALVKVAARFENAGTRQYLQTNLGRVPHISTDKAQNELGMTYIDLETTLKDMGDWLIERQLVGEPSGRWCVVQ